MEKIKQRKGNDVALNVLISKMLCIHEFHFNNEKKQRNLMTIKTLIKVYIFLKNSLSFNLLCFIIFLYYKTTEQT